MNNAEKIIRKPTGVYFLFGVSGKKQASREMDGWFYNPPTKTYYTHTKDVAEGYAKRKELTIESH